MKFFYLVVGLSITQNLFAMTPSTPSEVASFVTYSEIKEKALAAKDLLVEFNNRSWEQLTQKDKQTILKSTDYTKDFSDSKLDEIILLIDVKLPEITNLIVSDKKYLSKVFYNCRRFLPEAYRGIAFEEVIPFDLSKDTKKVLAVGGTGEEIEHLSKEPYLLDASSICAINVLSEDGVHYIADMNSAEHMKKFERQFSLAFASAVPFNAAQVENGFKNIALSLKDNGFFIAYASAFDATKDPASILLQNGFASAKTIYRSLGGAAWFIAAKTACDDPENAITASSVGKSIYDYVLSEIDYHKKQDLNNQ